MSSRPFTPDRVLLRVVASGEGNVGEITEVGDKVLTIGRAPDCGLILTDPDVSQRHTTIQAVADGLLLRDLSSTNGTWVAGQSIAERRLGYGERFRIGSTLFECLDPPSPTEPGDTADRTIVAAIPPPAPGRTPYGLAGGFLIRVLEGGVEPGNEYVITERWATLGRAETSTVVLTAGDVTRHHSRIDLRADGFEITDLGSTNGTWLDDRRIKRAVRVVAGQRFRIGLDTIVECHPWSPASFTDPGSDVTVFVPATDAPSIAAIETEGEPVAAADSESFLLDDPESFWRVVEGAVDLYSVDFRDGAIETRDHFLEILSGQGMFGFDPRGKRSGFLAVPRSGTRLRKLSRTRLSQLANQRATAKAICSLVDDWVAGLTRSIARGAAAVETPRPDLKAGTEIALADERRITSADGVVWVRIWADSVMFNDVQRPEFREARGWLPVTPDAWLLPIVEEIEPVSLTPVRTAEAIGEPGFWDSLEGFHETVVRCEFIEKRLRLASELERLKRSNEGAASARERGIEKIVGVLHSNSLTPELFLEVGSGDAVLAAARIVGRQLGIEITENLDLLDSSTHEEKVAAIARSGGFAYRAVALPEDWWRHEPGPLLGQLADGGSAVAILSSGRGSCEWIDPSTGKRSAIDTTTESALSPFAFMFYRPFPSGTLRLPQVLQFALRGLSRDVRTVLAMGLIVGVFGMGAPVLTGWVVDSAIPEADVGKLWVFGGALLAAAIAGGVFKLTQDIATLRIQGRMESSVQAALWHRLLDLPATFFRRYSAGDLADRVAGIDAIQTLLSGAGIGAILGSISALFLVVLMYFYDLRLAVVAVLLTLLYVGGTVLGNYAQLLHQRKELELRGRIAGLVLNLITGVTKLRLAGAENRAFRVWAEKFARQKRIGFRVGQIQNAMTVFNSVFPIVSLMALFFVMLRAQQGAAVEGSAPLTTGQFVAFSTAYGMFQAAMQSLGEASMNLLRTIPIYQRMQPIVAAKTEVDDERVTPGILGGAVELRNVSFAYRSLEGDGPRVLNGISLKVEPGEFLAIVGGSGSGKSTLLRLLLGFEDPVEGEILYDGKNLRRLNLRLLREQLGVVLQSSRVFPAEIYRNIVGPTSRPMQDAWEAAECVGLADDIRAMPMEMHTYVAEGGGTLSGGQRQRLMLARAIVHRPRILFLDEATSALDNRTQEIVTQSLGGLNATRIVIAHRLSTIIGADRICFLKDGEIAESGTYQELIEQGGLFAALAERQLA